MLYMLTSLKLQNTEQSATAYLLAPYEFLGEGQQVSIHKFNILTTAITMKMVAQRSTFFSPV